LFESHPLVKRAKGRTDKARRLSGTTGSGIMDAELTAGSQTGQHNFTDYSHSSGNYSDQCRYVPEHGKIPPRVDDHNGPVDIYKDSHSPVDLFLGQLRHGQGRCDGEDGYPYGNDFDSKPSRFHRV